LEDFGNFGGELVAFGGSWCELAIFGAKEQ
jgi:hypothetical protein